jgi:hypothetical protein
VRSDGSEVPAAERLVVFPALELTFSVPCQAIMILDADFRGNGEEMSRTKDLAAVVDAAQLLGEVPRREKRWGHLPLCVLDAVYSIGARYGSTTRTVHDYARAEGLTHVLEPAEQVTVGAFAATELPVSRLRDRVDEDGPEAFARLIDNRQRTSPRGGVLKAEAAGQYARVLSAHGVEYLADVASLLTEPDRLAAVEADLARVPGHGAHGIRIAYLWMLAGDDDHVKPDRMVVGWLTQVLGRAPSVPAAAALVEEAAKELGVTPWELDHAIWNSQRSTRTRRESPAGQRGDTVYERAG